MNAEDRGCRRRGLIVRVIRGPFIDKVIRSASGETLGAVVEARWVCGVHLKKLGRGAGHEEGAPELARNARSLTRYLYQSQAPTSAATWRP